MFAFQRRGADKNLRNESQSLFTVGSYRYVLLNSAFVRGIDREPIAIVSIQSDVHLTEQFMHLL